MENLWQKYKEESDHHSSSFGRGLSGTFSPSPSLPQPLTPHWGARSPGLTGLNVSYIWVHVSPTTTNIWAWPPRIHDAFCVYWQDQATWASHFYIIFYTKIFIYHSLLCNTFCLSLSLSQHHKTTSLVYKRLGKRRPEYFPAPKTEPKESPESDREENEGCWLRASHWNDVLDADRSCGCFVCVSESMWECMQLVVVFCVLTCVFVFKKED